MNARFWAFINGSWAKITLEPHQELHWYQGGPSDEGWHGEGETWRYEPHVKRSHGGYSGIVYRCCIIEGADCDGRHTWTGDSECMTGNLMAIKKMNYPPMPQWEKLSVEVWDQYAELGNY